MKQVSIVIPYSGRKTIHASIKTILKQNKNDFFEIIVVGKDSNFFPKEYGIRAVDKGKILQPGKARNMGAKIAKGKILIFLDDDCIPCKNWLSENIKEVSKDGVGAVGARILGKSKNYFAKSLDFSNFTFAQGNTSRQMPICSASLAIKKEVFERIGGFDEKMRVGEDTDLCMRISNLGYKTFYNPKIRVLHDHKRESLKDLLTYLYNNGRTKGLIVENRYPYNLWFAFLKKISHPFVYWFFIIPFSILATFIALLTNLRDYPGLIFYTPGIFAGKLACQCGIWVWTLKKPSIFD